MISKEISTGWTSEAIVETYLSFFRDRGHLELPSSSLIPENDPTVLLTTAGMQQMIPYMLGKMSPPSRRLCSIQKCFRTTDIDAVGDRGHLTFFEMLGNFSIGDYFKSEMVPMAWELVTSGFGLPLERLWATVHPTDEEAPRLWRSVGLPPERIVLDESNFWGPPGASGPCGPDTEIYVDRGAELGCGDHDCCRRDRCRPGCDCERYLEIWNLVFMEFFQDTDGGRRPLEQRNIDTGLGLERLTSVLQGTPSVYETDLFLPIIREMEDLASVTYGEEERLDYSLRVLADHGRAMTYLAGDGVLPSNEGRGYVLRRVIRRAVRYGRRLGLNHPFLADLADVVIERMSGRNPSLAASSGHILQILGGEEEQFLSTLKAGESLLDRSIEEARAAGSKQLSGERVFQLHDTYGFPRELSEEIAAEAGLTIGLEDYERAMAAQRERSRGSARFAVSRAVGEASQVTRQPATMFVGYDRADIPTQVLALQHDGKDVAGLAEGEHGTLVLAETPFYAESGGQVGDAGEILTRDGRFIVEDTQRDAAGHTLHIGHVVAGEFGAGQSVEAVVDDTRRRDVMRHHSATHLLHSALHHVLGPQAMQAGSLVAPHVARFDFPHGGAVDMDRLEEVEERLNRQILADVPVTVAEMPFREAVERGAMAIFGEKYGDRVRMVTMNDFSKELCGGTHVGRTGELGAAYIVTESGIGSGMRRIELVAGRAAYEHARARTRQVTSLAARLASAPDRLSESVEALLTELRHARRRSAQLEAELARVQAQALLQSATPVDGTAVIAARVEAASMDALLGLKDVLREGLRSGVIVLGSVIDGRPQFVASVSPDVIRPDLDAVSIVREVAAVTGGGGGGKPDLARAGGQPELAGKLEDALVRAREIVRARVAR